MREHPTIMKDLDNQSHLKRVLTLRDLVVYGIVLIQPVAPMALFGFANRDSGGHAVTAVLCAMVAILFTAVSYGKMASRYPSAGSAYTYVGHGLNPNLGFMAGFTMFLDYLIVPVICVLYASIAANHLVPAIPVRLWLVFFSLLYTIANLRGVAATARVNMVLMVGMTVVVLWYMIAAVIFLVQGGGGGVLLTHEPFYHNTSFDWRLIARGTALAALTYIGFDGLTTLGEEVKNPKRNIMLATVLTCLITGIWSGMQVYLAQAVVPWGRWDTFISEMMEKFGAENAIDRAMIGIGNIVGGSSLENMIAITLLVATVGSGIAGMTSSSRILYCMGRDKVIPGKIFGYLGRKHAVPTYNIILIGIISFLASNVMSYDQCAHLINFGAFLAFMLVNLASFNVFYLKSRNRKLSTFITNGLPPIFGFIGCFAIWVSLPLITFAVGGIWFCVGIAYLAYRTKFFRVRITLPQDVK